MHGVFGNAALLRRSFLINIRVRFRIRVSVRVSVGVSVGVRLREGTTEDRTPRDRHRLRTQKKTRQIPVHSSSNNSKQGKSLALLDPCAKRLHPHAICVVSQTRREKGNTKPLD